MDATAGQRHVSALENGNCEDVPMTRIRLAAADDLDDLVEKDRLPQPELTAILGQGRILVAEDTTENAAMIGWLRWGLFWDEVPFMNRLHVAESRRGHGVGSLLVAEWERTCVEGGHATVMTSTVSAEPAQHFYRKLGYIDAGCLILPGESAEIFFTKHIARSGHLSGVTEHAQRHISELLRAPKRTPVAAVG